LNGAAEVQTSVEGEFASTPNGVQRDVFAIPTSSTVTGGALAIGSISDGTAALVLPIPFAFAGQQARIPNPPGLGNHRPAETLQGFAGGVMQAFTGIGSQQAAIGIVEHVAIGNADGNTAGNAAGPNAVTSPADRVQVTLDPAKSTVQATLNIQAAEPTQGGFQTATYKFGSDQTGERSAYVDYDHFGALDKRGGDGGPASTVNGNRAQATQGYFISATPAIKQKVQETLNVKPCECEYTRWGFWGMTSGREGEAGLVHVERAHMNTWVAGRRPEKAEVPTTGAATYKGHLIGNVRDNGVSRLAGGHFTKNVNFATRAIGTTARFDNARFAGTTHISSSDPRNFGGMLGSTTHAGREMRMDGSFFRGKTNAVGEMGGNFRVNGGANYQAGGIFAGKAVSGIAAASGPKK
jgi:hypothetical protein